MKIRLGFVSNSSSTSFCIYGLCLEGSKAKEIFKVENVHNLDSVIPGESGLNYVAGQESYYVYLGRPWSSVEDDETGLQFRTSILQNLKKLLPDQELSFEKLGTHEESWYNG